MAEATELTRKRGHVKSKLTRFIKFLNDCDNEQKIQEIPSRLEKIQTIWKDFDDIQVCLEDLAGPDCELESDERDDFENKFHSSIARATKMISTLQANYIQQEPRAQALNAPIQIIQANKTRLPTIDIPKFDGSWEKWLPFRDTFTSMVHNNQTLPTIDKLHYLRWALVGDAHKLIDSLEITAENYATAWDMVSKRYKNDKTIIQHHVQALIDFPCITKESHIALRQLADTVQQHIRTLKRLRQPTDQWDTILIQLFIPKLDSHTRREWESERADKEALPTMDDFTTFLDTRCSFLEALTRTSTLNIAKNAQGHSKQQASKQSNQVQAHVSAENLTCPVCQNTHKLYECIIFRNMTPQTRLDKVKGCKLCYNCLKPFHGKKCTYGSCKKCHKYHNTLLHIDKVADSNASSVNPEANTSIAKQNAAPVTAERIDRDASVKDNIQSATNSLSAHYNRNSFLHVLLSTAIIHMRDCSGKLYECRALLDSGSQPNFMSQELCELLKLPQQNTNSKIEGVNSVSSTSQRKTTTTIYSRFNNYRESLSFLVVDKVTNVMPAIPVDVNSFQIPANIKLADPTFHVPGKVDLIIGSEVFWRLLCVGQIQLGKAKPIFQKTKLGWIVSGTANPSYQTCHAAHCHLTRQTTLQNQLEGFWRLEEIQPKRHLTPEEQSCEEHFNKTHTRDGDGRFIVELPLRENYTQLGDSYDAAKRRLFGMERKLARQPALREQYNSFMREYIALGHMKAISNTVDASPGVRDDNPTYYLPHHAVIKPDGDSSRLRVVFDASAKTTSGLSLNDVQMIGPTIQQDLFNIVTRFRKYAYTMAADISKMYRQVKVKAEQCRLQRIVWRFSPEEEIQTYELQTVTYGEACSAFLAIRSLNEIAKELQHRFPKAAEIITRDFYVDDLLTGDDDINSLSQLKEEITTILQAAKFELHKWKANHSSLIETGENKAVLQLSRDTKILGQLWDTQADTFGYTAQSSEQLSKPTKRHVLSCIAQLFDPLGLLGPVITRAKIIMQQLWQIQLGWDESLPTQLHTEWTKWYAKIKHLNQLKIPRRILCDAPTRIELHGFCDASERAYGACLYIRSTDLAGQHHTRLLCAKSRVAPLKIISLPRLELCGALLLSQLYQKTIEFLSMDFDDIYFWSDSTIALSWIAGDPSRWSVFVANRTSEIQRLSTPGRWYHVRSELNPADALSRGIDPDEIPNHKLWWSGPSFLQKDYYEILSNSPSLLPMERLPETKKQVVCLATTQEDDLKFINSFSSLSKLKRIVAYCLRFAHNAKQKPTKNGSKVSGPLRVEEFKRSMQVILMLVQKQEFQEEISQLSRRREIPSKSKVISLRPYLDNDGLLRVGGRLRNTQLDYDQKHPIILPRRHHITDLIIREEHLKNLHVGTQALLSIIRARYWPVHGKNVIRRVLHKCIVCCRARAAPVEQLMGDLPSSRVVPSPPFSKSGVDYAGPFNIKISRNKTGKAYLCVFVCFVTKAVHLEIVSDLSTPAFLNALKRFIARRGKCISIHSDNGTNFVGANRALKEMYRLINENTPKIHDHLAEQEIQWHFLPPRSPHMGGLWESAVKSCKTHLTRIIGLTPLSFEELSTVVIQVEAILNSRPLTATSTDPNDLDALTPGHFLIGRPLVSIAGPDLTDVKINRLTRYQLLERMKQSFWKRWSAEYLTQLQQRHKWREIRNNVQKGTMVVLRDQNAPPMSWALGRILNTHPGPDGLVRVVDVQTNTGVYQRPLNKICVLPIDA